MEQTTEQAIRRKRLSNSSSLDRIFEIKAELKKLDAEMRQLSDELIASSPTKTLTSPSGRKATIIRSSTTSIDPVGLKASLPDEVWDSITTKVLDKKKLEAFVAAGDIDPEVVAGVTDTIPKAPYILFNR